MTVAALILAGGRGTRAGGGIPKQYREIDGISVLRRGGVRRFRQFLGIAWESRHQHGFHGPQLGSVPPLSWQIFLQSSRHKQIPHFIDQASWVIFRL